MITNEDVYLEPGEYIYTLPVEVSEEYREKFISSIPPIVENLKQEIAEKSNGAAKIVDYSYKQVGADKYELYFTIKVSRPPSISPQFLPLVPIAIIAAAVAAIGVPSLIASGSLDKIIPPKEDYTKLLYLGVGATLIFSVAYLIRSLRG